MESPRSPEEVRARLSEDLANGKTIVLSPRDLDDPMLREQLPRLLEDLNRAAPQLPGVSIPGYQLLGEIGQGGMSTVYLARQQKLGRHVAVKVAPKWLGGGKRASERLLQEAHAMARLTHPNIVAIHDIVDVDDSFAIAMEWIDGRTLSGLLRALPTTPGDDDRLILTSVLGTPPDALDALESSSTRVFVAWMRDIARAAHAVHEAGLLHLDIKPSNVLVRRDGTPLLADFGVVREITPDVAHTMTFAGTPVYAPPEQIRRVDARIGPASDVYALGMTLYELLARRQPLRALDPAGIVECIETGRMPRLSQHAAVTPDLENIVHKAIQPEPENRYASAEALADDLQAFLDHRPVVARPLTSMQRLRRWARTEPWKAGLAATMAVLLPLLLGIGTYLLIQMPALERIERMSRLREANQLKQQSYQMWLTRSRKDRDVLELMSRAIDLDPGDASIATHAHIRNIMGRSRTTTFLAERGEAVADSLALQLYRELADDRRTFFDDEECERLRVSTNPVDLYLLALDRAFFANDRSTGEAYSAAMEAIQSASLIFRDDPLLYGLMAWCSMRADEPDSFETVARSIRQLWSDDPLALGWIALSIEPFDAERASRVATEIMARHPDHVRGYELLAGAHRRKDRFDEALQVIAQARARGVRSAELDGIQILIELQRGDRPVDDAALEMLHLGSSSGAGVRRMFEIDAAVATRLAVEILAKPEPSAENLHAVYTTARKLDQGDLAERAWQLSREMYRDHRSLHAARMRDLYMAGDIAGAAELCMEFSPGHLEYQAFQMFMPYVIRCLLRVGEWPHVRRQALHWLRHSDGETRQQAAAYAGMAASRLGELREAAETLALALHEYHDGTAWYVVALCEDAWIRCAPDSPEGLLDPALSRLRFERFERLNEQRERPQRGPWTSLVEAQMLWVNGEHDAARRVLERIRGVRRREQHAPVDLEQRIEAARQRFR